MTEIHSGRLEWSPAHRSKKFWRENAHRLNDTNYDMLELLVRLLESSKDPLVLSVACFDLGEYVRPYSGGTAQTNFLTVVKMDLYVVLSSVCNANDKNVFSIRSHLFLR